MVAQSYVHCIWRWPVGINIIHNVPLLVRDFLNTAEHHVVSSHNFCMRCFGNVSSLTIYHLDRLPPDTTMMSKLDSFKSVVNLNKLEQNIPHLYILSLYITPRPSLTTTTDFTVISTLHIIYEKKMMYFEERHIVIAVYVPN